MSTTKFLFVLFAFVGLWLAGCSDETQSPIAPLNQNIQEQGSLEKWTITPFTLTLHYPMQVLDPGTVMLIGGKWILKKIKILERVNTTSSLVTGNWIHSLSAILDENTGEGPVWGTFSAPPDSNVGGGVWEGTYTGYRSKTPGSDTLFTLPLRFFGVGKGGDLQGKKIFLDDVITAWGTPPVGWYGSGEGYIKSHCWL